MATQTTYPTIRQGSTGAPVTFLQKSLISLGYGATLSPEGADGIFGAKTNKAVREFQSKHGLAVDGIAGTNTWNKITALLPSSDLLVNTIQSTIAKTSPAPRPTSTVSIAPPPPPSLPAPSLPEPIKVVDSRIPASKNEGYLLAGAFAVGFWFLFIPRSKRKRK